MLNYDKDIYHHGRTTHSDVPFSVICSTKPAMEHVFVSRSQG